MYLVSINFISLIRLYLHRPEFYIRCCVSFANSAGKNFKAKFVKIISMDQKEIKRFIDHWQNNSINVISSSDWFFNPDAFKLDGFFENENALDDFASAHVIVFFTDKSGKIFLLLNQDHDVNYYNFPGGGRIGTETESQTLGRELCEELGVKIRPDDLERIGSLELGDAVFPIYSLDLLKYQFLKKDRTRPTGSKTILLLPLPDFLSQVPQNIPLRQLMTIFEERLS